MAQFGPWRINPGKITIVNSNQQNSLRVNLTMETFADQVYDLDLPFYCDEKTVHLEQTSNDWDGGYQDDVSVGGT